VDQRNSVFAVFSCNRLERIRQSLATTAQRCMSTVAQTNNRPIVIYLSTAQVNRRAPHMLTYGTQHDSFSGTDCFKVDWLVITMQLASNSEICQHSRQKKTETLYHLSISDSWRGQCCQRLKRTNIDYTSPRLSNIRSTHNTWPPRVHRKNSERVGACVNRFVEISTSKRASEGNYNKHVNTIRTKVDINTETEAAA